MHLAFKCTYCDGGQGKRVGFAGTCSDDILRKNVRDGRVWCGVGPCGEYYENGFSGEMPQNPCCESVLFRERRGILRSSPPGFQMKIAKSNDGSLVSSWWGRFSKTMTEQLTSMQILVSE